MSAPVPFPVRGHKRLNTLKAALRSADTSAMTTPEVAALCERALPDCTIPEIIEALHVVGDEQMAEAAELETVKRGRP